MHQRRLVGEQEQAARVFVESANARDDRVSLPPAGGQKRVDIRAFAFLVGAHQAQRFVQEQQQTVGMIERLAVDEHIGGHRFLRGILRRRALHGYAAIGQPLARFTA